MNNYKNKKAIGEINVNDILNSPEFTEKFKITLQEMISNKNKDEDINLDIVFGLLLMLFNIDFGN